MSIAKNFVEVRDAYLRDLANQDSTAHTHAGSDNFVRASAFAAVAEGLYQHQAWLLKQAFADSADSDYLEMHAVQYGIYRKAAAAAGGRGGCRRGHLQRPEREHLHGHPHAEVSRLLTLRRRRASFLCRRSTRHKQQRTQRKHERSGYMPLTTQPGYHWVSPRTPKSAEKAPAQRAP